MISRKNGEAVIIVPLAYRNATEETTHLLSQKANAGRLAAAISDVNEGRGRALPVVKLVFAPKDWEDYIC